MIQNAVHCFSMLALPLILVLVMAGNGECAPQTFGTDKERNIELFKSFDATSVWDVPLKQAITLGKVKGFEAVYKKMADELPRFKNTGLQNLDVAFVRQLYAYAVCAMNDYLINFEDYERASSRGQGKKLLAEKKKADAHEALWKKYVNTSDVVGAIHEKLGFEEWDDFAFAVRAWCNDIIRGKR